VRDQVPHLHKTKGKIIALHIFIWTVASISQI
jgi:hypothetical protein